LNFADCSFLVTQEAIEKKEQYLQEAKTGRKQLETSMHQVSDWLRGAEELLDSGIDGLDYSVVDSTLSEFTVSRLCKAQQSKSGSPALY
jgi:hypothetical protein